MFYFEVCIRFALALDGEHAVVIQVFCEACQKDLMPVQVYVMTVHRELTSAF